MSLLFISPSRLARKIQLRLSRRARLMVLLQRDWIHNLWTASCNRFRISAHILCFTFICWPAINTFHDPMERATDPHSIATSHEIGQALVLLIWSTRIPFVHNISVVQISMFLFRSPASLRSMPIEFNILYCYHTSISVWFFNIYFPLFYFTHAVLEQLIDETSFSGVILPSPEWNTLDHIGKNARITYR